MSKKAKPGSIELGINPYIAWGSLLGDNSREMPLILGLANGFADIDSLVGAILHQDSSYQPVDLEVISRRVKILFLAIDTDENRRRYFESLFMWVTKGRPQSDWCRRFYPGLLLGFIETVSALDRFQKQWEEPTLYDSWIGDYLKKFFSPNTNRAL